MFWRFLGILGESKNRQKTREIRQKITGRKRRPSGTVFGQFLLHFFANFKAQNTVKYSVFAIFVLKDNNVKCCKNIVNTDVFEGPCAENTVNTVVFGAMCKKPRTYRVFFAFWLKSIGIYDVFWTPNAENCVNSMVLERFWTSGKQKLLVFTGFCECNAWKTLVFAGFSRVFFLWFYHCFASIDGSCMLTKRYLCARARARASHASLSLILSPWRHRRCAKPVNKTRNKTFQFCGCQTFIWYSSLSWVFELTIRTGQQRAAMPKANTPGNSYILAVTRGYKRIQEADLTIIRFSGFRVLGFWRLRAFESCRAWGSSIQSRVSWFCCRLRWLKQPNKSGSSAFERNILGSITNKTGFTSFVFLWHVCFTRDVVKRWFLVNPWGKKSQQTAEPSCSCSSLSTMACVCLELVLSCFIWSFKLQPTT